LYQQSNHNPDAQLSTGKPTKDKNVRTCLQLSEIQIHVKVFRISDLARRSESGWVSQAAANWRIALQKIKKK